MEILAISLKELFKKIQQSVPVEGYEPPILTEEEREKLGEPKAHVRLITGENHDLVEMKGGGKEISNMLVLALESTPELLVQFKHALERVKMRRTTLGKMLDEVMVSGDCECEDCTGKCEQSKE